MAFAPTVPHPVAQWTERSDAATALQRLVPTKSAAGYWLFTPPVYAAPAPGAFIPHSDGFLVLQSGESGRLLTRRADGVVLLYAGTPNTGSLVVAADGTNVLTAAGDTILTQF